MCIVCGVGVNLLFCVFEIFVLWFFVFVFGVIIVYCKSLVFFFL